MILVIAEIVSKDGSDQAFLAAAEKCVEATRKEAGNVFYNLRRNPFNPNEFTFVEEWETKESLEAHMKTAHFAAFGAATQNLVVKAPAINIYQARKVG